MTTDQFAVEDPERSDELRQDEVDDQFRALLEGLRTTIPGITVLFAFLLTLPLQAAFANLRPGDRIVFYIAFAASAASTVLIIAPSVHQRVRAPISGIKGRGMSQVMMAAHMAIAGTVLFLVAIAAVVFLISDIVLSRFSAAVASVSITAIAGWAWFWFPLAQPRAR